LTLIVVFLAMSASRLALPEVAVPRALRPEFATFGAT
jgi:hypothetical protein